jgi:hypothetical protein
MAIRSSPPARMGWRPQVRNTSVTDVDARQGPTQSPSAIERLPTGLAAPRTRETLTSLFYLAVRLTSSTQQIAAHVSPKTTKLYDRTSDTIALDEIERIVI